MINTFTENNNGTLDLVIRVMKNSYTLFDIKNHKFKQNLDTDVSVFVSEVPSGVVGVVAVSPMELGEFWTIYSNSNSMSVSRYSLDTGTIQALSIDDDDAELSECCEEVYHRLVQPADETYIFDSVDLKNLNFVADAASIFMDAWNNAPDVFMRNTICALTSNEIAYAHDTRVSVQWVDGQPKMDNQEKTDKNVRGYVALVVKLLRLSA